MAFRKLDHVQIMMDFAENMDIKDIAIKHNCRVSSLYHIRIQNGGGGKVKRGLQGQRVAPKPITKQDIYDFCGGWVDMDAIRI